LAYFLLMGTYLPDALAGLSGTLSLGWGPVGTGGWKGRVSTVITAAPVGTLFRGYLPSWVRPRMTCLPPPWHRNMISPEGSWPRPVIFTSPDMFPFPPPHPIGTNAARARGRESGQPTLLSREVFINNLQSTEDGQYSSNYSVKPDPRVSRCNIR